LVAFALAAQSGCSLRKLALNNLADAASTPGTVYAADDDPELVRDSVPVMIKLQETILDGVPKHRGLLEGLARTCTQYAVAFIQADADVLNEKSVAQARKLYTRSRHLLLRARDYGLRGIEVALAATAKLPDKGDGAAIRVLTGGNRAAVAQLLSRATRADVGLLYWTGAAWISAIATNKNDMALVGDVWRVEALMKRALDLDETFDEGALHEFFLVYDAARPENEGGGFKKAKEHFDRAMALSKNRKLMPLVSYAENVSVARQDRKEFRELLERVVKSDVDAAKEYRLVNILALRRAEWLLSRIDDLFA
jgi:hypothetical protein